MKYRIIYFFAAMQDWPSQYGDEKLCSTAKYPEKRDVIKVIVRAMGIRPDSAEEKKLYKELYKELKYEILLNQCIYFPYLQFLQTEWCHLYKKKNY